MHKTNSTRNVDEIHRNRTNGHWNSMVSLFDMAGFI